MTIKDSMLVNLEGEGDVAAPAVRPSLLSSTRGAVLPEFAVVIGPLLAMFFSLIQLTQLYVANIALKHATLIACRAAIVTQPSPTGLRNPDVHSVVANETAYSNTAYLVDAARASMVESDRNRFQSMSPDLSFDANRSLELRIEAVVLCSIPLGARIACSNGTVTLHGVARLPYQGVQYE